LGKEKGLVIVPLEIFTTPKGWLKIKLGIGKAKKQTDKRETIKKDYEERVQKLEKFKKSVTKEIAKSGFTDFHSDYRVKGLYSAYKKYLKYKKDIDKIYDFLAMRILVRKTEDCYKVLGIIHSVWRPALISLFFLASLSQLSTAIRCGARELNSWISP
jgi:hypothetical protein